VHFTLHLTTACNMRCSYCYSPPHGGAAMSPDIGRRAMDLGARLTDGSCGIVFFGGEPLLHKDLIRELVAYGRGKGPAAYHFKLTTNGLLLDDDFIEFSLANDVLIAMSFDGVADAHDAHRRLPDGSPTFDLLLPRLKMLLEARPYASVLMVVNPDTVRHLSDSVSFLLDLGCRYVIASLNYAADWSEAAFRTLEKQYRRLGRLYVRWTRRGRRFYLSPFEVKLSSHINRHCYRKDRCELAQRQVSVGPGGYLYPCVQFTKAGPDSEWCIGSVRDGIDEGARQRIHADSEREKEDCAGCALDERCNNTCGCLNWQDTGSINRVSPVLCQHERILTPIADRVGERLYRRRDPLFLHKHYNAAYPVLSLLEDAAATR
jgi:uncharacterized protein